MKPGDHPQFFRFPAPEGRSRESTIVLDAFGHFFHDGERVAHPKLEAAMHTWIDRHPDDGRFVLQNGYDWTYFTVTTTPYFVRGARVEQGRVVLLLSDDTEEDWDPEGARVTAGGALVTLVKRAHARGPFQATFTRHAQAELAPVLEERDGAIFARVLGAETKLG